MVPTLVTQFTPVSLFLIICLSSVAQSSTLQLPNTGLQQDEIEIHRSFNPLLWDSSIRRRISRSSQDVFSVLIDAGSSGNRIWIYTWNSYDSLGLPEVRANGTMKEEPGLSANADSLPEIKKVLIKLIDFAKTKVPEESRADTPIFLFATAGLRMLPENKANNVVNFIYDTFLDKSISPFLLYDRESVRILSGEEEGVFMWLAVNYLRKALATREGVTDTTVGILELGGASTQIAFIPSGILLANKFPLDISENRFSMYVHSYLDYGQERLLQWIQNYLINKTPNTNRLDNPCMLTGQIEEIESKTFVGTSKPRECVAILEEMVYKVDPSRCHPKPCAIGQAYQPSLPADKTFYALGAFAPVLKNINAVTEDKPISLNTARQKAEEFCSKSLSEVPTLYPNIGDRYVTKSCVTALYFNVLLIKGYGFSQNTDKVWVKDKIDEKDIDWTLGAMLYERFTHPVYKVSASAVRSNAWQISSTHTLKKLTGAFLLIAHYMNRIVAVDYNCF